MDLKDVILGNFAAAIHDLGGSYSGSSQEWLPIKGVLRGVVITRDKRFAEVLELLPVNLYTFSKTEQGNAIADLVAYPKVASDQLQINVPTQKFNLNDYLKLMKNCLDCEQDKSCREMILESMQYVPRLVEREAITHRFFLAFSYELGMKMANNSPGAIAACLNEQAEAARRYLDRCGISVLESGYVDNFVLELFYELVNKHISQYIRLPESVYNILGIIHGIYDESVVSTALEQRPKSSGVKKKRWLMPKKKSAELPGLEGSATTIPDLIASTSIDTHSPHFLLVDGVYHAYLYIVGYEYATVVGKGWLIPLIEAGEGVSVNFQLRKQPREEILSSIPQTIIINRSRMRDVGDTRGDFEELGNAVNAGLYLKEGVNREGKDLYFIYAPIEVVADDLEMLEQRVAAVEALRVASDMSVKRCESKNEQASLSFLPGLGPGPDTERKSRKNALTTGVAGAFPFAPYELSNSGGTFLGPNLYDHSPVLINFYDDYKYANGNSAVFGSIGAGKSTILQSIGKRVREQGCKVICIVPEKGYEYRPLCESLGSQFIKLGPASSDCIGSMEIRCFREDLYSSRSSGDWREPLLAEKMPWLSVRYSLQKRNLSEGDWAYIGASLIECYRHKGITFDNSTLYDQDGVLKEMPVIEDWYDVLVDNPKTKCLAVALTRYVSDSVVAMGGRTGADTDNPYLAIDLTNLSDGLILPSVYTAIGFVTGVIVQNGDVGIALLSDELWEFLGANSNPLAVDYIMRMVKLIRSQGGIVDVTPQGMVDMMTLDGGKYGKAILDSCRIKFIMQMEEQKARLVRNILNLTEEEVRLITRFRRGESLLCIGRNHVPISVFVSPKECEVITTSLMDRRARNNV